MTYTQLGVAAVVVAVVVDWAIGTRLVTKGLFWTAYAIMIFFQFVTNAILTGSGTVHYADWAVFGPASPETGRPPFLGDGRLFYAPAEDVLFGFAMVLWTLTQWVYWGRRGVDRTPHAGPPIWRRNARATDDAPPRQAAADSAPGHVE